MSLVGMGSGIDGSIPRTRGDLRRLMGRWGDCYCIGRLDSFLPFKMDSYDLRPEADGVSAYVLSGF